MCPSLNSQRFFRDPGIWNTNVEHTEKSSDLFSSLKVFGKSNLTKKDNFKF